MSVTLGILVVNRRFSSAKTDLAGGWSSIPASWPPVSRQP